MNCVLTYIFGKNKEKLREPLYVDDNTEYICVTDQDDIKSTNFKIIIDKMQNINSLRDKFVYVKFNPFKYSNADKFLIVDGSMQIKNSIATLFELLNSKTAVFKKHRKRKSLDLELNAWRKRGLSNTIIEKFNLLAKHDNVLLNNVLQLESNIFLLNNTENSKILCNAVISYMKLLSDNDDLIMTNQCALSYIVNLFFKNDISLIDFNTQNTYFTRFEHNSIKINNT